MHPQPTTVDEYIAALPPDRRPVIQKLRQVIRKSLPEGFQEVIGHGMICYVVPHSTYPAGYHANPAEPLPFLSLASQKNYVAIYHMGLYADPPLLKWFKEGHAAASSSKLTMGKSCIRYSKEEDIPYDFLGQLFAKISPQDWIFRYEASLRKTPVK